jgi:hypothetical protein
MWLIKTDTDGNELWDKTFGETTNGSGNSVEQTTDGGYILCGKTQPNSDGISAVWLIKTDGGGNRLWDKTFTSGDKVGSWGNYAQQVTDGGYIVCGVTGLVYTGEAEAFVPGETKAWLIKTDKDGNKVWDKTFGDEGWSAGNSVEQTTDGGYIICGDLLAFPELRTTVWLIKIDKDGNKLWDKKFGGKEPYSGQTVRQTADGGYIICGIKFGDNSGGKGAWLIKTKANGNKLWDKTFNNDVGNAVQQATDGGYIICGMRNSAESANADALLFKVDADGNKLWDKILTGEKWAAANSIQQTKDGGYAVIIGSSSGILLYKMAAAK